MNKYGIFVHDFYTKHIEINYNNLRLSIGNQINIELSAVSNSRLLEAFKEKKVYFDCTQADVDNCREKTIYLCSRDILKRRFKDLELRMDFLIYNQESSILPHNTVNRSLGHRNDENEYEVHQVLSGIVLSVVKTNNDETYIGIFRENDYFEIPPGAFHCTYILQGPAMLANFYCNAFWENDISTKPYFNDKNDITVESHGDLFKIKTMTNGVVHTFNANDFGYLRSDTIKDYNSLYLDGTLKKDYKAIEKSIFDLFYAI